MVKQTSASRREVIRQLGQLRDEIRKERDYIEFAATTDLDYAMAEARLAALREEESQLRELLKEIDPRRVDVIR